MKILSQKDSKFIRTLLLVEPNNQTYNVNLAVRKFKHNKHLILIKGTFKKINFEKPQQGYLLSNALAIHKIPPPKVPPQSPISP
jgi:hypothetical protein